MITGITGALRAVCNVAKALHHAACAASFLAILTILPGCYAGLAAVVLVAIDAGGAGSAGSGAGNAPAVLSGVTLTRTQRSPAEISFILTDPEADPVDVEISYARGAGGTEFPVLLTGTDRSLRGLATSKGGTRHSRLWDFESQLGAGLADGFTVTVTITGGPSVSASDLSLGNDPPRVFDLRLPAAREAVGIVNVVFKVADSSEDLVSVKVEYSVLEEGTNRTWHTARPARARPGEPTPELAFTGIQAKRGGTELDFNWDVVADLGSTELDVSLRFTALDAVEEGVLISPVIHADNNQPPIARLDAETFVLSSDVEGVIAVPFEVRDAEGDLLRVVFQWRKESQPAFPPLPEEREALEAVLLHPAKMRELQIATESPRTFEGTLFPPIPGPEEARRVRLELAGEAAALLASPLESREMEVLRNGTVPVRLESSAELIAPVSALPLGDGTTALVLDQPRPGGFRLRVLSLGNGAAEREVLSAPSGQPSAMALEEEEASVLIALHSEGGAWSIRRVSLAGGQEEAKEAVLIPFGASSVLGPVRGLLSLGAGTALATAGDSLLRLDFTEPESPRLAAVLAGLKSPRGLVRQPGLAQGIYLAEQDWTDGGGTAGRILELDLATLARKTLVVKGIGLPRPEGLALERNGSRLLAITSPDSDGGKKELRGLDLGSWAGREPILIAGGIEGEVGSVAAGPDRLRLIALTGAGALSVAGGLVEKRTIAYYDVSHQEATLDQALSAAAGGSNRWRIRESLSTLRASPGGVRRVFQWDSGDLRRGGRVVLRVVPYDADRGIESDSAVPRPVLAPLPMRPILLGSQESTPFPIRVFSADLDGDGDQDLAAAGAAIYAFRRRAG